jgi:aspartate ammonia-lyase
VTSASNESSGAVPAGDTAGRFRGEHDLLGKRDVPVDALYGVHTVRAAENFPLTRRRVRPALVHAFGAVKLAAARTNQRLEPWPDDVFGAIETACGEMMTGALDEYVIVDALQGGAGTSTNMNVNEVIANRALQRLGRPLGDYEAVSPLDDINKHQSTNDTYPTALKVAAIHRLRLLEEAVVGLVEAFHRKEKETAHIVKIGRTEMQDAVPTTLGREMSAYAEAFARDRWRIYKCEERLRVVNMGGTAIGTGEAAPRAYILHVVEQLHEITGLGLARAENLVEATQNVDAFVEVSGILKACASNLFKVASDLRLMSSGPVAGFGEIILPAQQAGSSIMPGKVNPVIPEAVSQAAMQVMANDLAITLACSAGNLELNAFLPLVADNLLASIDLLTDACTIFRTKCVEGLRADEARCRRNVECSTATATALVGALGYSRAQAVAQRAHNEGRSVRDIAIDAGYLTAEQFDALVEPEAVLRLGAGEPRAQS